MSSSLPLGPRCREPWASIQFRQIEGWIPIFLFALLFGLSMDYEVFLVTRMREAWDAGSKRRRAGRLERTGDRPAGVIMGRGLLGFRRRADRGCGFGSASPSRSSSTPQSCVRCWCRR